MFERRPSKAELRSRLKAEVEAFVNKGGQIQQVKMGESGLVDGRYPLGRAYMERPAAPDRTPVPELLVAIDSRRKSTKPASPQRGKSRRTPSQKTVYDDFGEPLRKIWVEE